MGCLCGPEIGCLCVDNSPESQRSVENPQNSPQKPSEALRGWSDREEKGARARPAFGGYWTRRCGAVVGAIAGFDGERIKTPLAVA